MATGWGLWARQAVTWETGSSLFCGLGIGREFRSRPWLRLMLGFRARCALGPGVLVRKAALLWTISGADFRKQCLASVLIDWEVREAADPGIANFLIGTLATLSGGAGGDREGAN
jgi:hypothetical protein